MDDLESYPAPWTCSYQGPSRGWEVVSDESVIAGRLDKVVAERMCLWRNAEDVMMRRGWWPVPRVDGKWVVHFTKGCAERWMIDYQQSGLWFHPTPFTALIEADKWYEANVEKAK